MANTRLILRRIQSTRNIAQITRAMQMVAASKMKRAQDQALASKPYSEKLQAVLASLLTSSTKVQHKLLKPNSSLNTAVLLVTTNKGLCGGLNTNHFRLLNNWLKTQTLKQAQFITVGKKGWELILKLKGNIAADFSDLSDNFTFTETLAIAHFITKLFKEGSVGKVFMSYTNFISTLSQKPKIVQLLPINLESIQQSLGSLEDADQTKQPLFQTKEYVIEPSPKKMINWLLPYFIELEVYHFLLESKASEHSARMVAMKSASENANDLVSQLRLEYNKARQQIITAEIADIVTAWKSL